MYERTDETPWAAVPLLDSDLKPTLWLKNDWDQTAADLRDEGYTIQYRPKRRKVKPKTIET